jgi:hypothetical protein
MLHPHEGLPRKSQYHTDCGLEIASRLTRCLCPYGSVCYQKDMPLFEKKQSYTPAEAKRAYDQLEQLIATEVITARQAAAHRRHIASRVQVLLKPSYSAQAARRAKSEIVKLTEAGTITMKSAAAYRAHITKRTLEA